MQAEKNDEDVSGKDAEKPKSAKSIHHKGIQPAT
jgi:hypothetical protein